MEPSDLTAVVRMALIFSHVLAFAVAAAAVGLGDFALFGQRRINIGLLQRAATGVIRALIALWLTGLCVIWIDTRFDASVLLHASKLLAKLTVSTAVTLNGFALHRLAFPRLRKVQNDPDRAALLATVLGVFSATSWLFAAFLGVANAIAPLLGYLGFMSLYLVALCAATTLGVAVIRPQLARRMGREGHSRVTAGPIEPTGTGKAHAAR